MIVWLVFCLKARPVVPVPLAVNTKYSKYYRYSMYDRLFIRHTDEINISTNHCDLLICLIKSVPITKEVMEINRSCQVLVRER